MNTMKIILLYFLIKFVDCKQGGFPNLPGGGGNNLNLLKPPSNKFVNELPPLNHPRTKFVIKPKKSKSKDERRAEIKRKLRHIKSIADLLSTFPASKSFLITQVSSRRKPDKVAKAFPKKVVRYVVTKVGKHLGVSGEEEIIFAHEGTCEPAPKPRDISYLSSKYQGEIYPSCITYNQCGGCCPNNYLQECVPSSYKTVKVHVFVISHHDANYRYVPYIYKEHTGCKCECKTKKEHCKSTQTYDPGNCQCGCNELTAKKDCSAKKQWSNTDCDCVCKHPDTTCPSNKVWNKETCSCECVQKGKCHKLESWDSASCHCINRFNG